MNRPRLTRFAWISGASLGLVGVLAGAFGAHALENTLSPEKLAAYETAVRYQIIHALFLLILGILQNQISGTLLRSAIVLTFVGTCLFSGSIYILSFFSLPIGIITPIGGSLLILGWAQLLLWAIKR